MKARTKWLSFAVSLGVIFSMALLTVTTSARAAVPSKTASHHTAKHSSAKIPTRCKSRVKASGTAKFSDWEFPDNLNPDQTTSAASVEVIGLMQDGLFKYNPRAQTVADMLVNIPSIKNHEILNGGREWIFKFKKGMRWSDGQQITSHDFKFSWLIDSDAASGPLCAGSCDVISRIDTPNNYTANVFLKRPSASFFTTNNVGDFWPTKWPGAWSGNAHQAAVKLYQDTSFLFNNPSYPTNGPYQATSFVNNDRITLRPSKQYNIMSCGGHFASVIFPFYSDVGPLIAAAARHEVDLTTDYTLANVGQLNQNRGKFKTAIIPSFFMEHLEFNTDAKVNGASNPLHNVNARLALALGINKIQIIRSELNATPAAAKNVVAYSFLVNTPALKQPFVDRAIQGVWDPLAKKGKGAFVAPGTSTAIKDAKALLRKAGFPNGFTIQWYTTTNPVRDATAALVAKQLQPLKISLSTHFVPATTALFADWQHGGILYHGTFEVAEFAYIGAPDPEQFKFNMQSRYIDRDKTTHSTINANNAGIRDKIIDAAYTKADTNLNPAVRQKYFTQIQVEVAKKAYWDPIYFRPDIYTNDGKILGVSFSPTSEGAEWNGWAWHHAGQS